MSATEVQKTPESFRKGPYNLHSSKLIMWYAMSDFAVV